jgi:hypothetical protein
VPQASKTEHRVINDTSLPYISNDSITSTDPHFIKGSQNILTSLRNWAENRPGFSLNFDLQAFVNLQRNFIWRRWTNSTPNGGQFIWMACDIVGGQALVYKKVIGVDAVPVLIWTSTSAEPFDFVVSSNYCFFGNGTDMRKYDSSRLTTWGGSGPVAGPSITLINGVFVLTAAANASAGTTVYTGTITGGGANALVGNSYNVAGFDMGANNGGPWLCSASSGTTLTLANTAGVADTNAGTATDAAAQNVYTSWCYCTTYWDAIDSHETSPSPISACSGVFQFKKVQLGLTASTNPRFSNIRVYRTPDGGAQDPALMQEIAGSPFPNTTGNVIDTTPDVNLSIRTAPEFFRNNPPTPCKGFVTYGGRIWGFVNNTTYYSGFEEISNGVPEECWPGGLTGNYYPWANEVYGHAPLIDGIAILQADRISKIEGDSLDTFRRYTLLEKRGTRSRTTVAALGGSVVWLDTSSTIWLSDVGEIGIPIRPDTQNINPATCWITLHIQGTYHWVVVLDGANGILYVYDLDRQVWMPPWTVGTTASALFSGETSIGIVNLLLARNNTKVQQLSTGYTDDTSAYVPSIKTNLFALTPDGNPSFQGTHDWTEIKTDTVPPSQVLQLVDDDPTQAPYTDITANGEPSPLITQGKFLQSWRYPAQPESGDFISIQMNWPGGGNFHLYNFDLAFHPAGG